MNETYAAHATPDLMLLFILLAALRGADYFQAALLAQNERSKVLAAQFCYLIAILSLWLTATGLSSLLIGMAGAAGGYILLIATLTWLSVRRSHSG